VRISAVAVGGVAIAVLAVPATAGAATKSVSMGPPSSAGKKFQKLFTDANDFFPHGVTIHVGDSVRFIPTNFHTVEFPARGAQPAGLVAPSGVVSNALDPAGQTCSSTRRSPSARSARR
jgi:plastocyanin